ncbi:hypothetical protein N431DRAFT_426667 [Stipitochalara longipes BDJ]|nr:hypothetical protein N431DRAFT_426667 [Stipitochalara longipes BDJ]
MREYSEPSHGRSATISTLQEIVQQQHVVERHILSRAITTSPDAGSTTVFVEMKNKLHVLGKALDTFFETAVVTFDGEGLIAELRNYSCRSHIVEIVQKETGEGPYSEGYIGAMKGGKEARVGCCG